MINLSMVYYNMNVSQIGLTVHTVFEMILVAVGGWLSQPWCIIPFYLHGTIQYLEVHAVIMVVEGIGHSKVSHRYTDSSAMNPEVYLHSFI